MGMKKQHELFKSPLPGGLPRKNYEGHGRQRAADHRAPSKPWDRAVLIDDSEYTMPLVESDPTGQNIS